jgi:hypothetical protein
MLVISALLSLLVAQAGSIPAGTPLKARLESSVRTQTSKAGDGVVAILVDPIRLASKVIVPQGSRLIGRVETIEAATQDNEGRVRLVFREIQFPDGRRFSIWITNAFSASPPKRNLKYLLYMGIGGAAGSFIGGKTARLAGVLGGTLVGFVVAGNSGNAKRPDLTLGAGHVLHLRLGEDLTLQ